MRERKKQVAQTKPVDPRLKRKFAGPGVARALAKRRRLEKAASAAPVAAVVASAPAIGGSAGDANSVPAAARAPPPPPDAAVAVEENDHKKRRFAGREGAKVPWGPNFYFLWRGVDRNYPFGGWDLECKIHPPVISDRGYTLPCGRSHKCFSADDADFCMSKLKLWAVSCPGEGATRNDHKNIFRNGFFPPLEELPSEAELVALRDCL